MKKNNRSMTSFTAEMLAITSISVALLGPAMAADKTAASSPDVNVEGSMSATAGKAEDFSKLLPVLLTSPERKQLAADLEASLRQGDVKAAEKRLNAAIEMGTLAIVLVDRLGDQNLLNSLQTLGIRGEDHSTSVNASAEKPEAEACPLPTPTDTSSLTELQQTLEQERAQRDAIAQELASLTQDHRELTAQRDSDIASYTTKVSELQGALRREQERGETAGRQLASLQEEYRSLRDLASRNVASTKTKISELETAWQQERERSEAANRQLANAQAELRNLRSFREQSASAESSRIVELKGSLTREQERGDALARELANAIEELRGYQEQQESSETPLMFRLEANGAPTPLETLPQDETAQSSQALLAGTGAIAPRSRTGPEAQKVASASALPIAMPQTETAPPHVDQTRTASLPASGVSKPEPPAAPPVSPEDRLLTRAEELLSKGDVSGARLLLERSMEAGNARAAFLLAETFDPRMLSKLGVFGIRGDAAKARQLYARAHALGVAQAGERIEALK